VRWKVFEGIDEIDVRPLLATARRRRFRRGETIFHEGDPGDSLHLIASGHVAIRVATPSGDVATLNVLGPSDYFGELAALSTGRRSATVAALEHAETLEVSAAEVQRFERAMPTFDRASLVLMAHTVRAMSDLLLEARFVPAPRRVARRLAALADIYGEEPIPLSQDDLAGLSGATRQTVNRALIDLRDRGAIDTRRSRITIVDRALLEQAAR
jgi:CRP-like cAMP-binding protein